MSILLDTSVLLGWTNSADKRHPTARYAVQALFNRGELLHLTGQNLVEFWCVATRPTNVNGLGLSITDTERRVTAFSRSFQFLDDTQAIYPAWHDLVLGLGVQGKQVHDARIVAVAHAHGVRDILTFNIQHFQRLVTFWPGMNVIDPVTV